MAIVGIGIDLADVADMKDRIAKGDIQKAFSDREQAYAASRPRHSEQIYAANWAVKEAFGKALGTGLPFGWIGKLREIETLRDDEGRPQIVLGAFFEEKLPAGATVHVSLTHTPTSAGAIVVIES